MRIHEQRRTLSDSDIDDLLVRYLQKICQLIPENVEKCEFKHLYYGPDSPLIKITTMLYDFYLMIYRYYSTKPSSDDKLIAQEIPFLIIDYINGHSGLKTERVRLCALAKVAWRESVINELGGLLGTLSLDAHDMRAISRKKYFYNISASLCGVLRNILAVVLPSISMQQGETQKIDEVCAVPIEVDTVEKGSTRDSIRIALNQLCTRAVAHAPSLLLCKQVPATLQPLYDQFSSQCVNFDYYHMNMRVQFYFEYHRARGARSKGTIIFISDIFQDHTEWMEVVNQLRDEYDCLVFDNEGMGVTKSKTPMHDLESAARNIYALLRFLDIRNLHIVGHGYGGLLAMQLYHQLPDKSGKLVLLNTPLKTLPMETIRKYSEMFKAMAEREQSCIDKIEGWMRQLAIYRQDLVRIVMRHYVSMNNRTLFLYSANDDVVPKPAPKMFFDRTVPCHFLAKVGHNVLKEDPRSVSDKIHEHLTPLVRRVGTDKIPRRAPVGIRVH